MADAYVTWWSLAPWVRANSPAPLPACDAATAFERITLSSRERPGSQVAPQDAKSAPSSSFSLPGRA
jgi:hypothetical protein